jgi:hypothetical protein
MKTPLFARSLALSLVFAGACGDDKTLPDAATQLDAPVDAAPTPPRAVVVAGPFSSPVGVLSVVDLESRAAMMNVGPATAVGADPILRKLDSELFVINRNDGNNVTILSANDYSLVEQLATGAGSNPQDVATSGQKVFVALYGAKGLVELTRGSSTITQIDLSADDPDGKPNCASVYRVGGKLFVACQLLDDANFFTPRGPGKVYVVDIATRAISTTLTLTTKNPFSLLEQLPSNAAHADDLVIGTVDFADNSGCIERITTSGTPTAAGCLVTNTTLGGFAGRLEVFAPAFTGPVAPIVPTPTLQVLVPRADFSGGDVKSIELTGDTLLPGIRNTAGQALGDVAFCPGGQMVVAEAPPPTAPANTPAGLRIYAGATELTTAPVAVGLKPASSRGLICY